MGEAKRLCPQLVPIHYDFDAYREVSQALYDTVARLGHCSSIMCNSLALKDVVNALICSTCFLCYPFEQTRFIRCGESVT